MLHSIFLSLIGTLGLLAQKVSAYAKPSVSVIPAPVSNSISQVQFKSSAFGLDAPHVRSVNATTWDWWYFDVVSADQKSSIVIVFYTAPATGFVFNKAPASDILLASINVGIPGSPSFFSGGAFAEKATIVSLGNGARGCWEGTGFEFIGAPDLSTYTIVLDSPDLGVKGTVTLKSVSILATVRVCLLINMQHSLLQLTILARYPKQIRRWKSCPISGGQTRFPALRLRWNLL